MAQTCMSSIPGAAQGDSGFNLDTDTHAVNLLTQKLAELRDGAGSDTVSPSRGLSPTGLTALWCTASSLARSHSMTPSHGTSLVRACSNSMSSASSHDSASDSPAASDHEGPYRRSTSLEGDGSNDNGMANSTGEAPIADKHPDSDDPTVTVPNSDDAESRKAGSDEDGSASPRSHSSFESEVEVVTVWKTARTKKTLKSTSTIRDAKTHVPGPTQPISDADKVSEVELRNQQHQDARLLDKDFGAWHNQKIGEGCKGWKKHTKMHCDHGEAHKELPHEIRQSTLGLYESPRSLRPRRPMPMTSATSIV